MKPTSDTNDHPLRTKFDRWLWERDITNSEAGKRLGCAGETVRRYRLAFGADGRRIPDEAMLAKIFAMTQGEIAPADFYAAEFTAAAHSTGAR